MIKLPTVKVAGKEVFVLNRQQVEDDADVAAAICKDAERFRWMVEDFKKWTGHDLREVTDKRMEQDAANERIRAT